ncbi:2'-5' RNA ligase family protein [Acuticoccus mangrovi]|uniref:2'-5' RNA ligase family protein n=1 Tax=Acuticoccus mangrovi TaxID=2796142 RepID=A0A934MJK9_9HYPH|nr:2'-5' RNA ligase family protein [Acuticoccus mangrovi]MBJ3774659.1 2'-5' RNA ligase family protein [Acuticoccus mangrovi]
MSAATGGRADSPIILTLQLDAAAMARFEAARRAHFPPSRTLVGAHLTLFHALPGALRAEIVATIAREAPAAPFPMAVDRLMPLGRGVAYGVSSATLLAFRERLARAFAGHLSGQDRERFRPHVTVQNKVSPAEARATLAALSADFAPFTVTAEGVQLWAYEGGPWAPLGVVSFARHTGDVG